MSSAASVVGVVSGFYGGWVDIVVQRLVDVWIAFPALVHPAFDYGAAAISLVVAVLGIGIAAYLWFQHEELGPFKGLTQRNKVAHAGYEFLANKYYLDALYENLIVASIKGPIAAAAYWVNQKLPDESRVLSTEYDPYATPLNSSSVFEAGSSLPTRFARCSTNQRRPFASIVTVAGAV